MKIVRVKLSPEAEEVYKHLNEEAPNSKTERMVLKAVVKNHRSETGDMLKEQRQHAVLFDARHTTNNRWF